MSKLTDEIVNKGIAEFMGHPSYMIKHHRHVKFTSSLDALVPVWEKMERIKKVSFNLDNKDFTPFRIRFIGNRKPSNGKVHSDIDYKGSNVQQAAAYATYKAIKELSIKENR